jgi:hypothetical protein
MPSSGTLHHVAIVITEVPEERIASIIRVTRIGELGTLAETSKPKHAAFLRNVAFFKSHMA